MQIRLYLGTYLVCTDHHRRLLVGPGSKRYAVVAGAGGSLERFSDADDVCFQRIYFATVAS